MVKAILDTDTLSEHLKGYDQTVIHNAERYATEHGIFTRIAGRIQIVKLADPQLRHG